MNRLSLSLILGICCLSTLIGCQKQEEGASTAPGHEETAAPETEHGQTGAPAGGATASAAVQGTGITGTIQFSEGADGVHIVADVTGLAAGQHGIHIHENGDCTNPGNHLNPFNMPHGCGKDDDRHLGDIGNVEVGADGKGRLDIIVDRISLTNPHHLITGKAIVIHSGADDCKTQPSGGSGDPVACGVIQ